MRTIISVKILSHPNCGRHKFSRFVGVKVVANFFLGQSIGIVENNTFSLKFSI